MGTIRHIRVLLLAMVLAATAVVAVGPAAADFGSPNELATAMDLPAGVVEDVTFTGDMAGAKVHSTPHLGFPTNGGSYVVLATGVASDIDLPNDEGNRSTDLGGPVGAAGQDQVQLQLQLDRPGTANCLSFDFMFLSEEFPEFVGSNFNDTFTAEIIDSDITYENNEIVTPFNFAYDNQDNPISVNSVFGVSDPGDTTYDGATPRLSAVTPAEENDAQDVLVTLTIQDVGDSAWDSAVMVDNMRFYTSATCEEGAVADSDGDALLDDWETDGLDVDGDGTVDVDLPAMGADPMHKDLFLELDWMLDPPTCIWIFCFGGRSMEPDAAALAAVRTAFANAPVSNPDGVNGINIHIDAGPSSIMDGTTTWGALSGGNAVPHAANLGGSTAIDGTFIACDGSSIAYDTAYDWSAFDALKDSHFDPDRRDAFHYVMYADQYNNGTSSGISRGIPGGDLIVSQGAFNSGAGFTTLQEQGTLMHELGHNLALRHGGDDNCNREPNYLSIMSYSFQFPGLRVAGADGTLDYSRNDLNDLNEAALDETIGLGPNAAVGTFGTRWNCGTVNNAAGAIDWNCDGDATDTGLSRDINGDGQRLVLDGHDDWDAIRFDGGAVGALGDDTSEPATLDDELTKELAEELGVLSGEFDSLVTGPATAVLLPGAGEQEVVFEIHNVGSSDDTYDASASGLPGASAPSGVDVDGGTIEEVAVTVDTDDLEPGEYTLEVEVASTSAASRSVPRAAGDSGTATVAVTVPDLSDADVLATAEQACGDVAASDDASLTDAVRDAFLDMCRGAVGVHRLGGGTREGTAALVSRNQYPDGNDIAVVARSDQYADALAGGPLAFDRDAPILLTPSGALHPDTRDELKRLGATEVIVLGGEVAVSKAVADAIVADTPVTKVTRIFGGDRFDTAAKIAASLPPSTSAFVTEGANPNPARGWPDAVSVSGLAAGTGTPILLVTRDSLPEATREALEGRASATIVGGEVAVSPEVAGAVDAVVGTVSRIAGGDRYATSLAVANASIAAGFDPAFTWFATGQKFPDAIGGGPAVAKSGGVLLLVPGDDVTSSSSTMSYLDDHADEMVVTRLLGGTAAISEASETAITSRVT